jgi:hypothetical protein
MPVPVHQPPTLLPHKADVCPCQMRRWVGGCGALTHIQPLPSRPTSQPMLLPLVPNWTPTVHSTQEPCRNMGSSWFLLSARLCILVPGSVRRGEFEGECGLSTNTTFDGRKGGGGGCSVLRVMYTCCAKRAERDVAKSYLGVRHGSKGSERAWCTTQHMHRGSIVRSRGLASKCQVNAYLRS